MPNCILFTNLTGALLSEVLTDILFKFLSHLLITRIFLKTEMYIKSLIPNAALILKTLDCKLLILKYMAGFKFQFILLQVFESIVTLR